MSASLVIASAAAGLIAAPTMAGAADFVPDHVVVVHPTYFEGPWGGRPGAPTIVYARPGETIEFRLADPADTHHTVTLEHGTCDGRPDRLCERAFDVNPPVIFRFSSLEEYPFYDRYAREEARPELTGKFVITDSPPPIPPATTTTTLAPATTTTTGQTTTTQPPTTATTAAPTTSTTAPGQIRPFVSPDPSPTTTTMPAAASVTPVAPGPAPAVNKDKKDQDKDKGKAKGKAAGAETATTVAPVAPDAVPTDIVFDPSTLTPSPPLADVPGVPGPADVNLESSAIMNLLDDAGEEKEPTDYGPLLLVLGGLALVLSISGVCIWFGRPSRYDPA